MSAYVTDTHAILWHLSQDPALSSKAAQLFAEADAGQTEIFVPSIALVEIVYLCERQRVPADRIQTVLDLMQSSNSRYRIAALDLHVIHALWRMGRDWVPDMPDRIIAATALYLGLPLITRDSKLQACAVITCIW